MHLAVPITRQRSSFVSWKTPDLLNGNAGVWESRISSTSKTLQTHDAAIVIRTIPVMLNVSANHLAKVETGSRCCSIELLQDLSSCLNVRTDYLLNGDAPHNNHLRERLTFLAQELEKITADLPVWG